MSGVKILHTGDLHLCSARRGVSQSKGKAELINTFFRILALCRAEAVDFLLISGDLFETPFPDKETVSEIVRAMAEIPDTIIAIAPGNHDCACAGSVYSETVFPENVYIFTSFTEYIDFPEKNVRLFGAAFTDRFERIPLLSGNNGLSQDMINLCVLHGDLVAGLGESEYNPITLSAIGESGFDYLALGHIHKRSPVEKSGKTFYAYCGCPDGRGFDEDGSHGVYLGTIEKGLCKIEYRELSSRKYIYTDIDISGIESSVQITSAVLSKIKADSPDSFTNNLYRVSLWGTVSPFFSPNLKQIEAALGKELIYIEITDRTEADLSEVSKLSGERSLRGIFVKNMLDLIEGANDDEKDLYALALRLGLRSFEREVTLDENKKN